MDKRTNRGAPKVEYLQFAGIRSTSALQQGRADVLRGKAAELQPYDALYLGEIANMGESWFSLTDPYYVPAAYFEPEFRNHADHPEADDTGEFICAAINDTRAGRLEANELLLLRAKQNAYWTRLQRPGDA